MNAVLQMPDDALVLSGRDITKQFERGKDSVVRALDRVSIEARRGELTAFVGPDGAGKTTLLRLATGLMRPDSGSMTVLGFDTQADAQANQDRISYMPQRFGLYEDLSVQENLDLYADLHGVSHQERATRYPRLMEMTALEPFRDRLAGKLSGGMKQKLGLACTLVRFPELLLLDEPTVGVDPLSRRELWEIVHRLVEHDGLSVIVSTSYMDEAEHCSHVVVLHEGRVLDAASPNEVRQRAATRTYLVTPVSGESARKLQLSLMQDPDVIDAVPHGGRVRLVHRLQGLAFSAPGRVTQATEPSVEDGFMVLLRERIEARAPTLPSHAAPEQSSSSTDTVIEVRDLVRKFGDFTAVDRTSFEVKRGEVFGLLGPNGAGKTTTFRMLCGLLPATSGTLRVAGADLRRARAEARRRIGYVAQKFSLYGDLSVHENLEFFGGAYGLRNDKLRSRIAWALEQFDLGEMKNVSTGMLPGGFQRRLAMAAALLHEPEILFLDEPTSGADPLARREFWARITALADQGTTIIVTTHFMEEAEYCDRIMIQDAGAMLAMGTPAEVRTNAGPDIHTMEEAFIAIVEKGRASNTRPGVVA
jgi:ABC-2 type transport system ATP-binding protein